jgi:hypothetical protein
MTVPEEPITRPTRPIEDMVFSIGDWPEIVEESGAILPPSSSPSQPEPSPIIPLELEPLTQDGRINAPNPLGASNGKSVIRQLHLDALSSEQILDRLVNYLAGKKLPIMYGGGTSSLQDSLGINSSVENVVKDLGGGIGLEQIFDITTVDSAGYKMLYQYFMRGVPDTGVPREVRSKIENDAVEKIADIQKSSSYLMIMPDISTGVLDEEGFREPIGLMLSYDGTPYGEIDSINDLMPRGGLGPMEMATEISRLTPEQREVIQQEMWAMGYLKEVPSIWGQDDNPNNNPYSPLQTAMQEWQADMNAVGLELLQERNDPTKRGDAPFDQDTWSEALANDGYPRADIVLDRAIQRRMSGFPVENTEDKVRAQVTAEASEKVTSYLTNRGVNLTADESKNLIAELNAEINQLAPEQKESLFGEGGTEEELIIMNSLLSDYYGNDDWSSLLQFGNKNRDASFLNYAFRSGAISSDEKEQFNVARTPELEKDVALATLSKFIGDFTNPENITNGLTSYMKTLDAGPNRQYNREQLEAFAMKALHAGKYPTEVPNNQDTVIEAISAAYTDDMDYTGVSGWQYRNLLNALDNAGAGSSRGLDVRNV